MSINIFSHINIKFNNHYRSEVERTKRIELDDNLEWKCVYDTDELKRIDKIFEELNEERFNFTESFQPYYIHYVDLETIREISTELYFIEKKKNPYINIAVFKKKYFDNVKYYLKLLVAENEWKKGETKTYFQLKDLFKPLQESIHNCFYNRCYMNNLCNFYILDDFFTDIYVLQSYAFAFLKFIEEFEVNEIENPKTPLPNEIEPITLPENIEKIKINGNYQMLCFLFNELIEKGYITAPQYNGKISSKRTAEMLLKHFEFTNNTEQPTAKNLEQYIKNNTYSLQKQSLFKIPKLKNAND